MVDSAEQIERISSLVTPIRDALPQPHRNSYSIWATGCLLAKHVLEHGVQIVDTDASDFQDKAMAAVEASTDWKLHRERAGLVIYHGGVVTVDFLKRVVNASAQTLSPLPSPLSPDMNGVQNG